MFLKAYAIKVFFASIIVLPLSVISAPIISVEKADYDVGLIFQSEKPVEYTFKIKNTGDSAIKISKVKAGCGCTTVGYDSIIEPGQTGNVTQSINIKNMYGGTFKKQITVFSNAKNSPELMLSLGGTIKKYIEFSKPEIRLTSKDQKVWYDSFTVSTEKKDLVITEVAFTPYSEPGQVIDTWQKDLKIYPKFSFAKSDSIDKNFTIYTMKIFFAQKSSEPRFGGFLIKTNHPKMSLIKIGGAIDGKM